MLVARAGSEPAGAGYRPWGPMHQRFAFRFAPAYARAACPFVITPARAFVEVDDSQLLARYGPWQLRTPLANIVTVELTGPYRFLKTAGPARLAVTDLGLTFASNGDHGVLISFADRVPGIEPTGVMRHGELTVTVERCAELRRLLIERTLAR